MELISEFLGNMYRYGNVEVTNGGFKLQYSILKGGKISSVGTYQDSSECIDLDDECIYSTLARLAYYSIAEKTDIEIGSNRSLDADVSVKDKLSVINKIYNRVKLFYDIDRDHVDKVARTIVEGDVEAGVSFSHDKIKNNSAINKTLSIGKLLEDLSDIASRFSKVMYYAVSYYKDAYNEFNVEERYKKYNKYDGFLNSLYGYREYLSTSVDLESLDLDYEFLTDREFLINPAIGCEEELNKLKIALVKPSKSALIVGPSGTGKTAIVEGFAYLLQNDMVPESLKNKRILKINTSSIVRGCQYVGMFEEKVEKIINYLLENKDVILYIDELHTSIGLGTGSRSNLDLANILKPYLERGAIKMIGATTDKEYDLYFSSDNAFDRRFQLVKVKEAKDDKLFKILTGSVEKFEEQTNVEWNFDNITSSRIIKHIMRVTDKKNRNYSNLRYNPDISLDIMESAFAISAVSGHKSIVVDDIAESIRNSEFLYESVRNREADALLEDSKNKVQGIKKSKIIKFPSI